MHKSAGYLGPIASFSQQAANAIFPQYDSSSSTPIDLRPLPTFTDIFAALEARKIDYGVIPFENSTNGSVIPTLDLLSDRKSQWTNIQVVGEYYLAVHHCLLVPRQSDSSVSSLQNTGNDGNSSPSASISQNSRLSQVRKIYTHPQVWGQCENFLSTHLKGVERQDVSSTSKAAEIVSKEPKSSGESVPAAISSRLAAQLSSNLEILYSNIEDSANNVTRFFIFTRKDVSPENLSALHQLIRLARLSSISTPQQLPPTTSLSIPDSSSKRKPKSKALLSFTLPPSTSTHPGSLATALQVFSAHNFNLTSIDTRPSGERAWEYRFFVECEFDLNQDGRLESWRDERMKKLTEDLNPVVKGCRVWGCWDDMLFGG